MNKIQFKKYGYVFAVLMTSAFFRNAHAYPIQVLGQDEASMVPNISGPITKDGKNYDVIVIGAGLSGLSSAVYLTDNGLSVLMLEKAGNLGGLASGGTTANGVRYDRGAAYWTITFPEEHWILEHIYGKAFKKPDQIPEPADSFLWKGVLYKGIWEEETLAKLPMSFTVFQYELKKASKAGLIPNQPIEEAKDKRLDKISVTDWIRSMPITLSRRKDSQSISLYRKFLADSKVNRDDPMADVIELSDLYCRSALGTTSDGVSAIAFGNFYIAEIIPRYTTPQGTAGPAEKMEDTLRTRGETLAKLLTLAPVGKVRNENDHVTVTYSKDGKVHEAVGKYAIYAAPVKFAPVIIDGLAAQDPAKADAINHLGYAHYSVHSVFLNGHPYRASYDTWTRPDNYTDDQFTDVILGRWMDPAMRGYLGYRDFEKDPTDNQGIMTIYHPLTEKWLGTGYTEPQAKQIAQAAVDKMVELYTPLLRKGDHFDITRVETNRWPFSVHIAKPGHFSGTAQNPGIAQLLRRPFGHVYFANNNLGTPAFEEALFRGHCAADNILRHLIPDYKVENWTRCPLE